MLIVSLFAGRGVRGHHRPASQRTTDVWGMSGQRPARDDGPVGYWRPEFTPGLPAAFCNDHCRAVLGHYVRGLRAGLTPAQAEELTRENQHVRQDLSPPDAPRATEIEHCLHLLRTGQADEAIAYESRQLDRPALVIDTEARFFSRSKIAPIPRYRRVIRGGRGGLL